LNGVLSSYDDPVICTYDANLLNANLAIDILRTHPVAIIGGVLIENSFFSRPEEFLREVRERTAPPQPIADNLRTRFSLPIGMHHVA
jgi:hypothetical protein